MRGDHSAVRSHADALPADGTPSSGPPPGAPTLTTGPVGRTLLLFALPLLTTNVLQSLSGSVNAFWVSRALGPAALAATSNANLILFLMLGATFGVSMASNILVAQAIGGRDVERAKRVIGTSAGFFVLLSLLVAAVGFALTPAILRGVGTPAEALPLAVAYLRVIFAAMPFMFFFAFLTMTLRGAGDARTPFWFMLLSVVLDVAINPVLIMGLGPAPRLGIAGAAAATLVSQAVSLGGLLIYLYATRHFLRLRRGELGLLRPRAAVLRLLVAKGLPMGLQMMVFSVSALMMITQVNAFGVATTAAYGVVTQVWTYVQMPALAVSAAVSSMAGQSVGAGLWPRLPQVARAGVVINLALTGVVVLLLYLTSGWVFALFLEPASEALNAAVRINRTVLWSFVLFGYTFVLFGVARATGAVIGPLLIFFVSLMIVRPAFGWALTPVMGQDAIWWSFPVGIGTTTVLATLYYRSGAWKRARMSLGVEASPPPDTGLSPLTSEPARIEPADPER